MVSPARGKAAGFRLQDLAGLAEETRDSFRGLSGFLIDDRVLALQWPKDVVDQWLYQHADHDGLQRDYGHLDLAGITWTVEVHPTAALMEVSGSPSLGDCIDVFAKDPEHWVNVRSSGIHVGVREMWDTHGTWKRWPVLIDRSLVSSGAEGLQVIEGHTRVGVLSGRGLLGLRVADAHLAWVGRAKR